jgi:tRNA (mo5U34)-methyltransferase
MTDKKLPETIWQRQWFHRIELAPGVFTPGVEDTPRKAELIQFPAALHGKTVLDIGAYDGYFSFEAERRGASYVLAYDHLPPDQSGFNLAREVLESKVEHRVGSVYELSPETVGTFDIVLFLGVVYHLRSPLLALQRIHSVCKETMYLESQICPNVSGAKNQLIAQFFPSDELNKDPTNWWAPTSACLEAWITSHGFEPVQLAEWSSRAAYRCRRNQDTLPWYLTDY